MVPFETPGIAATSRRKHAVRATESPLRAFVGLCGPSVDQWPCPTVWPCPRPRATPRAASPPRRGSQRGPGAAGDRGGVWWKTPPSSGQSARKGSRRPGRSAGVQGTDPEPEIVTPRHQPAQATAAGDSYVSRTRPGDDNRPGDRRFPRLGAVSQHARPRARERGYLCCTHRRFPDPASGTAI